MRRVLLFLTLLLMALPAAAKTDLDGRWSVVYQDQPTPASLTLFVSTATKEHPFDELSGIYHDNTEAKGVCPVKGGTSDNKFNLTVVCPNYTIEFNGAIQPDGTITGNFVWDVSSPKGTIRSTGTFKMEKITCWLPEGCK